jgi:hypothetical protein
MASNNIIKKLKSHFGVFTDTALADKLNVSQPTIASWKNRKIPNHILMQYATILGDLVQADSDMVANREPKTVSGAGETVQSQGVQVEENQITIEGDTKVNSTVNKISTNDLLQDLDEKRGYIGYLKNEIAQLKSALNRKTIENTNFDSQPCESQIDVFIGFSLKGLTRTINSVTNLDIYTEKLGYTKKEMEKYWDVGTQYKFTEHPIEQIVEETSKEKFKKESKTLPEKMKDQENIIGDHFYFTDFYYIHKEGHKVPVHVSAKILWWEKKIISKLHFMNE